MCTNGAKAMLGKTAAACAWLKVRELNYSSVTVLFTTTHSQIKTNEASSDFTDPPKSLIDAFLPQSPGITLWALLLQGIYNSTKIAPWENWKHSK